MTITEIPSAAEPTDYVDARAAAMPDGTPQPYGYYPNLSGDTIPQAITWDGVDESGYDQVSTGVLDWAETIDQHPALYVTATWTPAPDLQRPDGKHDPLTDGPTQPEVVGVNQYYAREQGTSQTHFGDVPGRVFPVNGSQDGVTWSFFQDTTLAMLPLDPSTYFFDQKTGLVRSDMPDTLRAMPPSPVHGWVQMPADSGTILDWPEKQVAGRNELLANNTFAGQSFSQGTAHVVQGAGSVPSMRSRV